MEIEIKEVLAEHGKAVVEFKNATQREFENVKSQQAELQARLQAAEQVVATLETGGSSLAGSVSMGPSELVHRFTTSEQFAMLAKGGPTTGRVGLGQISVKSLVNTGRGGEGDTEFNIQPQRADGLYGFPQRQLSVLDLLPTIPVEASVFEYLQDAGYDNAAAFQVKEGDVKAETHLPTALVQAQIATIAHWLRASTQVMSDAPALSQQIGSLLQYGLLAKLEAEIVSGTGGQGKIAGLLEHATDFTVTGTPAAADAIGQAVTALNANGWHAGLIILNPADWFAIASERATGDGQYTLGSPRDPAPPALWGVPVVTTPSLAQGTALVLDPQQVAVLDRMQPTLLASRDDDKNFTQNLVTILAEMRAGLAVFAAGAVLAVTLE